MALITGQDLIDAGYESGNQFPKLLEAASEYEARGVTDKKYILKLLKKHYLPPPPKQGMREEPVAFTEAIEGKTDEEKDNVASVRRQMKELLRVPVIERGAVMPDACPAGKAPAVIPVGGAIAVENAIIPSAHSADICCSMYASFYRERTSVKNEIDALVGSTRFGPGGRHFDDLVHHPVLDEDIWENKFLMNLYDYARIHIADQGDGNHFAYLGEVTLKKSQVEEVRKAGYEAIAHDLEKADDKEEELSYRVLVTHHGSRGLGAHLYKRGQIAALKHTEKVAEGIPKAGAWLDASTPEGAAYWEALQYVGRWTKANHQSIHQRFLQRIGAELVTEFGNEHNFVWKRGDMFMHGKGATPAWKDESDRPLLGLIPLNMAEPILMVLGKDNDEYLSFAPHGAGRNISRTALKRKFPDVESRQRSIEKSTEGIDVRWYCGKADLSETPVAYKNADQVREQIEEFALADVVAEIKPLGCIMAGDSGKSWRQLKEDELTPKQKRQIAHRKERRKNRQYLKDEW